MNDSPVSDNLIDIKFSTDTPNYLLNIKTYHILICTCDHKCFEKTVIIKLGNKNDTERKQIFLFEAVLYCFV